ncbi:MAG: uroporphyrinogen decarboxylase family protein [Armatimonadota bacterium]
MPVAPRIFAWLLEYYGDSSVETHLRAADEFGFDVFHQCSSGIPNYIVSLADEYPLLPEVRVTVAREPDGDCTIVSRRFETPDGVLTDRWKAPPSRGAYGIAPNPVCVERLVKSPDDLQRLAYLLPRPCGEAAYHAADAAIGDRGLAEAAVQCCLDHRAGDARGLANIMLDYYDDREFVDDLLDLFHEHVIAETRHLLEHGVKIIFGSWYYASLSVGWSPQMWRELFLPRIREHVDLVHEYGALYHYYDDGKCAGILDDIRDCGVDVFSTCTPPPVGDFDLREAKEKWRGSVCIKGYVDLLYVIKEGTPELIEQAVREAMEIAAPGGGFILGTSDSIRDGTPVENVRAYFRAGRKYGSYHQAR